MACDALLNRQADGTNGHQLIELGDITGRALEVVLRRRYEGRGGMERLSDAAPDYPLQPADTAMRLLISSARAGWKSCSCKDDRGRPIFRFCDPFVGSGGFLDSAHPSGPQLRQLAGLPSTSRYAQRRSLPADSRPLLRPGADNSPGMIMKSRINLAAYGQHPRGGPPRWKTSLTSL